MKNLKKTLKYTLPVLVAVLVLGGVYLASRPETVEGQKTLELNFYDNREGDKKEVISSTVKLVDQDNALFLGDAIDNINDKHEDITILLEGSDFGRFILGVNDLKTENMEKGPWWGYTSENNAQCLAEGFCTGIDSLAIFDGDVFDFVFETPSFD